MPRKNVWSLGLLFLLVAVALSTISSAQNVSSGAAAMLSAASAQPSGAASETKAVTRPKSFDPSAMDKSVDPCENFYEYACGSWRKNNSIPSDQSRWGRFNELTEYNRQVLHEILEKDSANDPKRSPAAQKIGDFYASCMDETAANAKGAAPLKPVLDRIAAVSNKDQLIDTVAYVQSKGIPVLFGFGAQPDLHNASVQIAGVSQGGLGMPDRDYYLNQDAKSQETRSKYAEHLAKMFVLAGESQETAQKDAQSVLALETKLAEAAFE